VIAVAGVAAMLALILAAERAQILGLGATIVVAGISYLAFVRSRKTAGAVPAPPDR